MHGRNLGSDTEGSTPSPKSRETQRRSVSPQLTHLYHGLSGSPILLGRSRRRAHSPHVSRSSQPNVSLDLNKAPTHSNPSLSIQQPNGNNGIPSLGLQSSHSAPYHTTKSPPSSTPIGVPQIALVSSTLSPRHLQQVSSLHTCRVKCHLLGSC